jgi:hypothetical protein
MENLSDTYHDPSYRFPKIIIGRLTPPLKKTIGGVITIRQPTLRLTISKERKKERKLNFIRGK